MPAAIVFAWPDRTRPLARNASPVRTVLTVTLSPRRRSTTSIIASLRGVCR